MQLVVQVTPDLAYALRGESAGGAARELERTAGALGVSLEPMHAGTDDAELARFLTADVPDRQRGEEAAAALLACDGVEAAYVKPPDEPP